MKEWALLDSGDLFRVAIKVAAAPDADGYPEVWPTGRGLLNPEKAARADKACAAVALYLLRGGDIPEPPPQSVAKKDDRRIARPWTR
jgi:hypothetical protein